MDVYDMPQEAWSQPTPPPQQQPPPSQPPNEAHTAHMDSEDQYMETPPQDLEELRRKTQEMQQELNNNENERYHAKIEMERVEREAGANINDERRRTEDKANEAFQRIRAEWEAKMQNTEQKQQQTLLAAKQEIARLQNTLTEVQRNQEQQQQHNATLQAQIATSTNERNSYHTEMRDYQNKLTENESHLYRLLQQQTTTTAAHSHMQHSEADARDKLARCEQHIAASQHLIENQQKQLHALQQIEQEKNTLNHENLRLRNQPTTDLGKRETNRKNAQIRTTYSPIRQATRTKKESSSQEAIR